MVSEVELGAAFAAGLISFLSPCVLPLVPTYITYLTGASAGEPHAPAVRRKVLLNALAFVLGFSLIFVAFGLTASALGQFLGLYSRLIRRVSGVLIIFMGLYMTGLFDLSWLERERRLAVPAFSAGPARSLLVGVTFSAGWTPCIGPILTAILAVAANGETATFGAWLLGLYALGLGLPFLVAALSLAVLTRLLQKVKPHLGRVRVASGVLLMAMGVMVYTNSFFALSGYVNWKF